MSDDLVKRAREALEGLPQAPWKWQGEDYRGDWGWQILVDANGQGLIVGEGNDGAPSQHLRAYMPVSPELCKTGLSSEGNAKVNAVHVYTPRLAQFILTAPQLVSAMADRIEALTAERDALRAEVARLRDAIERTADQALTTEIPAGYGPQDCNKWTEGYDAAIRHSRAALRATEGGRDNG